MSPLALVLVVSVVVGFLMVVVFRYTSDQKAIGRAKDQLKANLLAVRLFQDQLPVVMRAYGRIFLATGHYLRLAFLPFLISLLPVTFLIIQLDRYLGSKPLSPSQPFLMEAQVADVDSLNALELHLPDGVSATAPPVHIVKDKLAAWRLSADRDGTYEVSVAAGGQTVSKQIVVSPGLARLSAIRLRGQFWERLLSSAESALPDASPVKAIAVNYPVREIHLVWEWNWIVLFFIVSLIAGFVFKSALGIQI